MEGIAIGSRARALRGGAVALAILALGGAPLLFVSGYAGDGIIHLVYAENAARGAYFEFNGGEVSPGVTSPGYMLILSLLFRALPAEWVPVAAKVLGFASWYVLLTLVFVVARRWLGSLRWAGAAALAAGLLPGSVYNAAMGMENGLFACVVMTWAWLAMRWQWLDGEPVGVPRDIALGALLGVAFWLRPEGGVVAAIAFSWRWRALARQRGALPALAATLAGAAAAAAFALGFGLFHHAYTGAWLPASGRARMFLAGLKSMHLGPLMIDPRFALRLLYYLPLTALFALANWRRFRGDQLGRGNFAAFASLLFAVFFVLYTFVFGTHHLSRYVLFLMPFLVLVAAAAGQWLHLNWSDVVPASCAAQRMRRAAFGALVAGLVLVYGYEARARIDPRSHTLFKLGDSAALRMAMQAPGLRKETSDRWLERLGQPTKRPVVLALQEVQLRYELDDRFVVRSLDGRVDPLMLDFIDGDVVDHPGYLKARDVDFLLGTPVYTHAYREVWSLWRLRDLRMGQSHRHAGLVFTRLRSGVGYRVERDQPEREPRRR